MIDLALIERIYVYKEKTDLRLGINKLATLAQDLLPLTEMKHSLFIFYGTTNKNIKISELDNDGWWLYQKKLHTGRYKLDLTGIETITKAELNFLLNGLSVSTYRQHLNGKINSTY